MVFTIKQEILRSITTDSRQTMQLVNELYQKIEQTRSHNPYPSLIVATHHFNSPYPLIGNIDLISLATMDLLIQFFYPYFAGYAKFTIVFTMKSPFGEDITFSIGPAIPLTKMDGSLLTMSEVYTYLSKYIFRISERYKGETLIRLTIRVYMVGKKKEGIPPSSEERERTLSKIINAGRLSEIDPITTRKIQNRKRSYLSNITAINKSSTKLKPFIVADTETLLINNEHKPYAVGLLMVRPGEKFKEIQMDTYFSEDYSSILDSFEERSTKVLYDFVKRISSIVRLEKNPLTIYFHNFSRFDGILLLKHLACHHKNYKLKPLVRNHRLYEIAVYSSSGKKLLFRFRDSLNLLPGKRSSLAKNLCPALGPKGSIDYEKVELTNLKSQKKRYIDYMKQDILLLAGVMQKAQEILWKLFNLDIESMITISSLSLSIFRLQYYDASQFPIHIPNRNEDNFIRRAYYGGHTDTYKPRGEDLYYYDVNSLYPFVMKEFPMPGGKPVWHANLIGKNFSSLFGFIDAYVFCPKTIKKPFLPYRDKNNTLIFPTGEFIGVYYSEELKYARGIGYTVIPISGYLFERMESPFKDFVNTLYKSRLEAKKEGNSSLDYVYKIIMNSLYGRFGINPKSTITEICDEDRYKYLIRNSEFISGDMLSENNYIVSYHSNSNLETDNDYWNPPKNSAVQLAAAITACARIHMYPYISREDSYYTDTDSVVLSNPLPNEVISSSDLGKFKLEDKILNGDFLAPKSYFYSKIDGNNVIKFKGPAKNLVTQEWFESQYADPSRKEQVRVVSDFRIDWKSLNIIKKETQVNLGIKVDSKRKSIYNSDLVWVDTEPIEVTDLSCVNNVGIQIIQLLKNEVIKLQNENLTLKDKLTNYLNSDNEGD